MSTTTKGCAVITGGTKGIGLALVDRFAAAGFDIATCARNRQDIYELKELVESRYENKVVAVPTDVSKPEDCDAFVTAIKDHRMRVDILINNAGVYYPGEIWSEPEGVLEEQLATNVQSAYRITRGLLPEMMSRKQGHIFNICSIASLAAYRNSGSYTISKFALYGLSQSLRQELKPFGIRVTSVMPGATFTGSWEGTDLSEDRFIPATDVAELIYSAHATSPRTVVEDLIIRPAEGDLP